MIKQGILSLLTIAAASVLLTLWVKDSYGLDNVSRPYNFAAGDTIKAARIMANYDTIIAGTNRLKDSVGLKFLRTTAMKDSNWQKIKVDSIKSNPNVDSISGLNVLRGNPDIDSMQGVKFISNMTTIDSLKVNNLVRDTSFACSLFDGGTYRATGTARAMIIGKNISLLIPALSGTVTGSTTTYVKIPTKFYPVNDLTYCSITVLNNGTNITGTLVLNTAVVPYLKKTNGDALDAGTGGLPCTVINYIIN